MKKQIRMITYLRMNPAYESIDFFISLIKILNIRNGGHRKVQVLNQLTVTTSPWKLNQIEITIVSKAETS